MITKTQALVVIFIKENPYCDIEDIMEGIGIPKNAVSRMLHSLDDDEVIEFTHDPNSFGSHNSQGGTSYGTTGWIIAQQKNTNVVKDDKLARLV